MPFFKTCNKFFYFSAVTLTVIIAILLLGLLLIFFEIFLIPGTTLFGVAGGLALFIGIVLVYVYYGNRWGNVSLLASVVMVVVAVVAGFKVIESNKLAMRAEITGKVNELDSSNYKIGDRGMTFTELRPNGKALINESKVEVYSLGDYVPRDSEIEITKITHDKIFVKPTTI